MATVESFVLDVLKVLLDWLSIAVILCIIYMLFQLVSGGKLGKLFGGGDDDDDSSNNRRRSKKNNTDGGENNGPEDTSKDYPDWADGLGTMTIVVTDLDDKPLQGVKVVVKHRKIPKMARKCVGNTGSNGTYGPKKIPAGQIKVHAEKIGFVQVAINAGVGAAIGSLAGLAPLGAVAGLAASLSDRFIMKDWFMLEKDEKAVFHVRMRQKKAQPDHAYEPFIVEVVENESQADGSTRARLVGRID
jgi:hypothetical protein